jgi:hypothetical protein
MSRVNFTEEQLLGWLNAELAKHDVCDDCRFTSVMRLRATESDGCNWSCSNLRCSGKSVALCQAAADELVRDARSRFNLKQSDAESTDEAD